MHECVNGADELIDGKGNENKLRATAVKILNRVAQGLDPVKATEEFISAFEGQVSTVSQELQLKEQNGNVDPRRLVLATYQTKIGKKKLAAQEKKFYDMLIGVMIHENSPNEAILRQEIYQKRYDVIQLQEMVENRIGKRITEAQASMEARERGFLEYLLLKEFAQSKDLQILEKLFCKTAAIFEDEYQSDSGFKANQKRQLISFKTKVENLRNKYSRLLKNLARDLRIDFRELTCAEYTYRSSVFKVLRVKVNKWKQEDFCEHHLAISGQKVSQSWVSRMEQLSRPRIRLEDAYKTPLSQRRRYVTLKDGIDCAKTFGVDNGVFLPSLFTS